MKRKIRSGHKKTNHDINQLKCSSGQKIQRNGSKHQIVKREEDKTTKAPEKSQIVRDLVNGVEQTNQSVVSSPNKSDKGLAKHTRTHWHCCTHWSKHTQIDVYMYKDRTA